MADHKQQTISVRGRETRIFRGGRGAPLLFLPDTFTGAWLPIHERLVEHNEVILPVHPGCAGSEEGFEHFEGIEDMVFHYLDLCEALHVDRPNLAGVSFGGWIAAEWAVRYSGSLSKLILIDAMGLRVPDAPAADILSIDMGSMRQALFADPSAQLALETVPDTPKSEDIAATLLARQTLARFAWQFPDNPRLVRYLYRVNVPTLIIWGERDGVVPRAHGKVFQEGIAGSQLVVIPSAGHLSHVEAAERCGEILSEFLNK